MPAERLRCSTPRARVVGVNRTGFAHSAWWPCSSSPPPPRLGVASCAACAGATSTRSRANSTLSAPSPSPTATPRPDQPSRARRIHVDATTLTALEDHRQRGGPYSRYVFPNDPARQGPWRPDRVSRAFRRLTAERRARTRPLPRPPPLRRHATARRRRRPPHCRGLAGP